MQKPGRNTACPCGSGKKYKQCCQVRDKQNAVAVRRASHDVATPVNQLLKTAKSQCQSGNFSQAEMICQQVLALDGDNYEALNILGLCALQTGNPEQAVNFLTSAIALNAGAADFHYYLGRAYYVLGKMDVAVKSFKQAVELRPNFPEAYNSLGNAFRYQGFSDDAIRSFKQAIKLSPDYAAAYNNLAIVYKDNCLFDEAIDCYRKALRYKPGAEVYYSNLLFCLSIYNQASVDDYLAVAREYGNVMSAKISPYIWPASEKNNIAIKKRFRIGFVSGDLRMHPVGYFFESILKYIESEKFELYAYSTVAKEDSLTERIKPFFKKWQLLVGLRSDHAAKHIFDDQLDCLVDLGGHTSTNSLSLFAAKPAPKQVSWLGYWASTGLPTIDYVFVDCLSVPAENSHHFTEKVFYLPDTRLCFTPPTAIDEFLPAPPPSAAKKFVTFGCFQKMSKITDEVIALWGKILALLPDAQLRVQNKQINSDVVQEIFLERLLKAGISRERVLLIGSMPRNEYLEAYSDVDMILDTFPFSGGTTTCEALWMGVPTLTLAGDTLVARQGVSIMTNVGLADWVCDNEADYVEKACRYSRDTDRLTEIRMRLRDLALASPLFDSPRFASVLQNALQAVCESQN